ncbi:MAG: HflK protein [Planctomycetota bacterium]|nr:MAG: HflK protein [Planctomycetota bacterium]
MKFRIPTESGVQTIEIPNAVIAGAALLLVAVLTVATSLYTVAPEQRALVLRFGQHVRTSGPGLHWRLPFWIERVIKVPVEKVDVEEFGYRTHRTPDGRGSRTQRIKDESIMLTGDLNIVFVGWDVQYRRANPEDYVFHVQEPILTLRDVAQTVMRDIVGDRASLYILTEERGEIQEEARRRIQERCDSYDMGVRVQLVNLLFADPPDEVKDSFHDLNRAVQDAARYFQEASKQYEEKVPRAQGEKRRVILEAEGYRTERIQVAQGEAAYFRQVLEEYRKYPQVTAMRLYVDAVQQVLPQLERVLVLDPGTSGGALPLLDLLRPGAAPSSTAREDR